MLLSGILFRSAILLTSIIVLLYTFFLILLDVCFRKLDIMENMLRN